MQPGPAAVRGHHALSDRPRRGPNDPAPHSSSQARCRAPGPGRGLPPPRRPSGGRQRGPGAQRGLRGAAAPAPAAGSGRAAAAHGGRGAAEGSSRGEGNTPPRPCAPPRLTRGDAHPRAPLPFPVSAAPPAPRAAGRAPQPPAANQGAGPPPGRAPPPARPGPAPRGRPRRRLTPGRAELAAAGSRGRCLAAPAASAAAGAVRRFAAPRDGSRCRPQQRPRRRWPQRVAGLLGKILNRKINQRESRWPS